MSGRTMLEAIVSGQAYPETMAQLAMGRMRSKIPLLEEALTGAVRDHHRFLLVQQLACIDFLDEQITVLNAEIERRIHQMSQPQNPETSDSPGFQKAVELLDTIPGVDKNTAEVIVVELGTDISRNWEPTTSMSARRSQFCMVW